jgi:hypothetical protein
MVFPDYGTDSSIEEVSGRIVLYEDGDYDFFRNAAAVNFGGSDYKKPPAGARSEVLDVIDIARPLQVGPPTGQGPAAVLPAPHGAVAINTFCSFCTGANRRGAVAFDAQGRASFYAANGAPLDLPHGGSFSIFSEQSAEIRTFVVAASTGSVQTLRWDPTP